jgi:16S rRNA (guanine966-N2)-methyltransferase
VIAGSARGRRLVVPEGNDVRPTKDMVREAMFSALDARGRLAEASVLDLYAGTGALAIEAVSRGAERAVLVERDPVAVAAINENLTTLGFETHARVVAGSVARFLEGTPPSEAPFDLVLCDPPYGVDDEELDGALRAVTASGWTTPGALVTVERPARAPIAPPLPLETVWERTFGDTLVVFLIADERPD